MEVSKEELEQFDQTLLDNWDEIIDKTMKAKYYKDEFIIMQRIISLQFADNQKYLEIINKVFNYMIKFRKDTETGGINVEKVLEMLADKER